MGDNGVGQQLDKSVPVFGGVMGGEQCIVESILAAYIVLQGPGPFPRQTLVVGVGAFGRGVSVNVNMRNDYIGIVFYQVDTALYLCQFGRIVSVFGIDGCFVEREVQIGTSAFFAHFPFFHLRSDERYVRMDIGKDVQAGQIGGVCMAGDSASAFFFDEMQGGMLHPVGEGDAAQVVYALLAVIAAA